VWGGKKILIIDDEPAFSEMLKLRLEANGYQVETAPDGASGLEKAAQSQPGLILLDVVMPGLDGFETLRRLHRDPGTSRIPVVMLTARGEFKSITQAQQLGAADYLIKPPETNTLLQLVQRYVR